MIFTEPLKWETRFRTLRISAVKTLGGKASPYRSQNVALTPQTFKFGSQQANKVSSAAAQTGALNLKFCFQTL